MSSAPAPSAVAYIANDPVDAQGTVLENQPKKSDAGAPELPAYDTAEDFKAAQPNKTADGHAADGDAAAASGSCGKKEDGCAGACAGQSGSGGGCA